MKKFLKKAFKGSTSRGASQQEDDDSSRHSSRRHSVSEMGSSDSGRFTLGQQTMIESTPP
ncbi:hypothetical protein U9M48_032178 [Paspalum notatum var. saurae]|uniref:Uncharacterized protein n=1 Tax=Paspalum notatum var. saurae TaxID=547442 RepID=A0AAQ3U4K5_PASNO